MSQSNKVSIKVNGDELEVSSASSLADLLVHLKISSPAIAVELNGQIVSPAAFKDELISEGDQLEIVTLVGGG